MISSKRKISADISLETQIANLQSFIKSPPENSRICEFSPELAQYILDNLNVNNRPMKSNKIVEYKKDMQANNWSLTGETIKFGSDGHLKDGQNRLQACLNAQAPFTSHTIFGVDPETFHHMDIGKNRNGSDTLSIMGVKNATRIALTIKFLLSYAKGKTNTAGAANNQEVKEAYLKRFDKELLQEAVSWGQKVHNQTRFPVGQIAATYYIAVESGQRQNCEDFYKALMSQTGKVNSPQVKLQTHLTMLRGNRYHISSHDYTVLLSRALHCFINNKMMRKDMLNVTMADKRMPMSNHA